MDACRIDTRFNRRYRQLHSRYKNGFQAVCFKERNSFMYIKPMFNADGSGAV
jgi:hypothetical protein